MADDTATSANGKSGDGAATPSPFTPPQISLPKGGGAIRGIGEKFAANPVTGSGSLTIPIATSPGRSGFSPQLSLSHDSNSGNGPFGMGWTPALAEITRKTEKGLPVYRDGPEEESDVFILSGQEDMQPVLHRNRRGRWVYDEFERDGYHVKRYRPRVEGLFARIERWTRLADGDTHWRSISKDNILTIYGIDAQSRIANPHEKRHVFSWLICRSFDDKGNAIVYEYASENDQGVDLSRPNERHRVRTANRYLKRIKYGNRRPLLLDPDTPSFRKSHVAPLDLDGAGWMFEVVFEYGDEHYREEPPDQDGWTFAHADCAPRPQSRWAVRRDPFSTWRSGFEVRTYRLCRRVLMFHHFPEELGCEDYLVRSTAFHYREKTTGSFLTRVVQSGHKRHEDGRCLTRSLPPLDLDYTTSPLEDGEHREFRIKEVEPTSLANLPEGIDGANYRFVDLDGEGISGVLSEQTPAWFYKPNLGEGCFGATQLVSPRPSLAALSGGQQQLLDVAGDGNLDLVMLEPPVPGFYPRTREGGWADFRPFHRLPVQDWNDPNLRFVDLTGDGIADILITEDNAFTWHRSLLGEGFGEALRVRIPSEEEKGPRVIFADGTQSIYLADMSGDGLTDIVRIRNGEVCYWPNRGHCHFGGKVTMDRSPWFDHPDLFDQQRVRLADTDGNGLTDILYLGRDGIRVFLNESGNGWSTARLLEDFPVANNVGTVSVVDFLGRGTACLLWSSPLPADAQRPLRYVDLMDGRKPHLLTRVKNNLGAETRIEYASSTEFYLADKAAGTPWVTRLAFPVHVVKRVETYDFVSRNRFASRYSYHHGYYDGVEREFRGFGRVDQLDTEEFATLSRSGEFPVGDNIDAASNVPPVLTKTWFHTGVYIGAGAISRHMAHEYYREGDPRNGEGELSDDDLEAMLLDDTILPDHIGPEDAREACRALKGAVLRQEVYALDGKEESCRPYTVAERNYTIRVVQLKEKNRYGIFFTHTRESITFHYERKLYDVGGCRRADPRVTHGVTQKVDAFGNVLQSVSIGYGRRFSQRSNIFVDEDHARQHRTYVTLIQSSYTNPIEQPDAYRTPLPSESRSYELLHIKTNSRQTVVTNLFRFNELSRQVAKAADGFHDLPFEDIEAVGAAPGIPYRRLLKNRRTLYRANFLDRILPLGALESLGLPAEAYNLALTPGLLRKAYARPRPAAAPPENLLPDANWILREQGGYVDLDDSNCWWIPSGRVFYSCASNDTPEQELAFAIRHFFLPHRFRDAFGNSSTARYDSNGLSVAETRDALGNTVSAGTDYRVLQPWILTDPNGNRSQAAFDAMGLVVGTAVMGKDGERVGDSLEGFQPDLSERNILEHISNPLRRPERLLGRATTRMVYDLFAYAHTSHKPQPEPTVVWTLARETHDSDLVPGEHSRIQHVFSYSDGFGREIQKKIQAAPGPLTKDGPAVDPRWVGSGWTIFDNKARPVRRYEPFFDDAQTFRFAWKVGVSTIVLSDPLERAVATVQPNHTYEKVVIDPWRQETWDVNDTVLVPDPRQDSDVGGYLARLPEPELLPTWYAERRDGRMGNYELSAASKTVTHADTPTTAYSDSLGRSFLTVVKNRFKRKDKLTEETLTSRVVFDIEGHPLESIDAKGRAVVRYVYDATGNRIVEASMEAGTRWVLQDVTGKMIFGWDSRGHTIRTVYDELRRPLRSYVKGAISDDISREIMFERLIHGDGPDTGLSYQDRRKANLLGKTYRQYDGAGVVTYPAFDFKGNQLRSERTFTREYRGPPDWSSAPPLEEETFDGSSRFDALNRPIQVVMPHSNRPGARVDICRPAYNQASLLERVDTWLQREHAPDTLLAPETATLHSVVNIDYDARGRRVLITYGNSARTRYAYDPLMFRLIRLISERRETASRDDPNSNERPSNVQDLQYTYDPIGNVIHVLDRAQQIIYFRNRVVEPSSDFTYDATYRLIAASGREHLGQSLSGSALQPISIGPYDGGRLNLPQPGDGRAMGRYFQEYVYDQVGNMMELIHRRADASTPNWIREFAYGEASALQPNEVSNRLTATSINGVTETYAYDAHGNTTLMPHLPQIGWTFKDLINSTVRQIVSHGGSPEITYYSYNAGGQRVRKVTERQAAAGQIPVRVKERLYLGSSEIYRKFDSDGVPELERQTLHVMDNAQRVCIVETRTRGTGGGASQLIRYQFANLIGSSTLELDQNGGVISHEEYYPFGSTSYQAVRSQTDARKRYRFTAQERDEESGFSYQGARYYAPWLARWTSCDPAGIKDGPNVYLYAGANPTIFVDPTGTQEQGSVTIPEITIVGDPAEAKAEAHIQSWLGSHGFSNVTPQDVAISLGLGPVTMQYLDQYLASKGLYTGQADDSTPAPDTDVSGPSAGPVEPPHVGDVVVEYQGNRWSMKKDEYEDMSARYGGVKDEARVYVYEAGPQDPDANPEAQAKAHYIWRLYNSYGDAEKVQAIVRDMFKDTQLSAPVQMTDEQAKALGLEPVKEPVETNYVELTHPLDLPDAGRKTVATPFAGGPIVGSGRNAATYVPGYGVPFDRVVELANSTGYSFAPHFRDFGIPGIYNASHAEPASWALSPGSMSVSRMPCYSCQNFLSFQAARTNQTVYVAFGAPGRATGMMVVVPSRGTWIAPLIPSRPNIMPLTVPAAD